jgi:hypothetical protein
MLASHGTEYANAIECKPRAALRLITTLGLRSVRVEVISFVAKSPHASTPNNLFGMQSEKRSRFQAFQSGSCRNHLQSSGFASLKIHAGIWLQPINEPTMRHMVQCFRMHTSRRIAAYYNVSVGELLFKVA